MTRQLELCRPFIQSRFRWILAFAIVNFLDYLVTFIGINGYGFAEANPVQNAMMIDPLVWTIGKLALMPILLLLMISRFNRPAVLKLLTIGLLIVVWWNTIQISGGMV